MPTKHMNDAETKLGLLRIYISQAEAACSEAEPGADKLLFILKIQRKLIERSISRSSATFTDHQQMKDAIREAGELLNDLFEDAQRMAGWYHGVNPLNEEQAFANLLSRIVMEMAGAVNAFEAERPELAVAFASERFMYAEWFAGRGPLAGGPWRLEGDNGDD